MMLSQPPTRSRRRPHQGLAQFLSAKLVAGWQHANWLSWLLLPISLVFRGLIALRRAWFTHYKKPAALPVLVIVVGNLYVGGTGKTPFTIWLVGQLRAAGFHPGVISRGYGAQAEHLADGMLVDAQSSAAEVGDEPLLIARRTGCPLVVGRRRRQVAQRLLAAYPEVDVIISDDGLQHYALPRQIEIVLFDGRGVGNGWLLPAGPLREPASRAHDFTVINGAAQVLGLNQQQPGFQMQLQVLAAYQLCQAQRCLPLPQLAALASQTASGAILAAAGIGHPERFFASLSTAWGATKIEFERMALPDHFDFAQNPFQDSKHELILITEKDAVKCAAHASLRDDPRIWVVPVEAQLDPRLAQQIVEKCRGCSLA